MARFDVKSLCQVVQGQWANPPLNDKEQSRCYLSSLKSSIDSREEDLKGKIFFAIKGSRFDGHNFLKEVIVKKASALVLCATTWQKIKHTLAFSHNSKTQSIAQSGANPTPPVILVKDTLKALQALASYWREQNHWKLIGITGSVGKTTTKHFCLQLLQRHFKTLASVKSFNNYYGVPLSLLSAPKDLDFFIQEIGMNRQGEIAFLTKIAKPDIALVTQVGTSHIGMLGQKKDIAYEKAQIYRHAHDDATLVFNKDNVYTRKMYEKFKKQAKRAVGFSCQDKTADVFLQVKTVGLDYLVLTGHIQGVSKQVRVPVTGKAHLNNLLSAVAVAVAAGVSPSQLWEGLAHCTMPMGRNQWVNLHCGARALFDGYNASPESVMGMLEHFLSPVVRGKKVLILGDFLELGSFLQKWHQDLAKVLCQFQSQADEACGLHLVWFIGSQAELFAKALAKAGWQKVCESSFLPKDLSKALLKSKTGFVPDASMPDADMSGRGKAEAYVLALPRVYLSKKADIELADKIHSMLDKSFVLAFKASRKVQMENVLQLFQPVNFHAL